MLTVTENNIVILGRLATATLSSDKNFDVRKTGFHLFKLGIIMYFNIVIPYNIL